MSESPESEPLATITKLPVPITRLVYKFGLLPPIENAEEVRNQMRLSNRYRNSLTEIEIGRRNAIRDIESQTGNIPALAAALAVANADVEAKFAEIKRHRAKTKSRSESPEQKEAFAQAKKIRNEAADALRTARQAAKDPEVVAAQKRIQSLSFDLQKNCYATNTENLFHGQRAIVEASADQAFNYKKTPLYENGTEPHNPKFKRFTGEGQIGLQIQDGLTWAEIYSGQDNRLRVENRQPREGWRGDPNSKRSQKNKKMMLALRIGSNEDRTPILARFPMIMDRELPPDSKIVTAKISCKRHGRREEWSVDFTLELPAPARRSSSPEGKIAVDIGWRLLGDEIRVASWRGSNGTGGELRLNARMVGGIRKPEEIRSNRDTNFNLALARLISDVKDLVLPEWFLRATVHRDTATPSKAQALAYLADWKSPARLSALCRRWRNEEKIDGDEIAYWSLETWRYHDRHLWDYECGQRRSIFRCRKLFYRVFAKEVAEKFDTLVIEDFDLSDVAKKKDKKENETARSNRQLAAVSELRTCLVEAFWRRGCRVAKIPAQDTTHICHVCGSLEEFDAETELAHTCSACGASWDQDENAAYVFLGRFDHLNGPNAPSDGEGLKWLDIPLKGKSKFQKRSEVTVSELGEEEMAAEE
jgi:transposase